MPTNWGNNNQDWQNASAVNRRRTFARPSVPVPPTVVYPNATTLVNWQQPWGDPLSMNTVRHPFSLAPITEIAPEILETKLSSLNVAGVCDLLSNIPDLHAAALESYSKVIQENNISGRVLLHCDLDELKKILKMNFGDWEIFKMLIVSLREQELSSVVTHREIKPRPLGITKQAASTTTRERKGTT
ncbi:kinase D-interacting substrate of 220 kDa B-like [Agrilus planipennis]|uniref:Kinase D-interacting substrate of 220 kDa B-like n=1 Tax=Agrilus planipennis TaxID=224129 RepID=A0A7F5R5M6_AGRPL|nr:kinase D-interacting substrate of 220 kDa B-like [Agrilus planipennis]